MVMSHPGLPDFWVYIIFGCMLALIVFNITTTPGSTYNNNGISLRTLPVIGWLFEKLEKSTWFLLVLKVLFAGVFIAIIVAGLWGTQIPERNIATVLTWNLWWTGLIIAIIFSGSAWCAICPWDNLSTWITNLRTFGRTNSPFRLNLKVPASIRNLWPATLLFVFFSWLELGVGIVSSPYATALIALTIFVMATTTLAIFEKKAFCRYMCPVGRTIGVYSQLAPIAIRPIDNSICASCKTLECFHGSDKIAPCPTNIVMGRLSESTYCTSCGNCTQSCPDKNVGWQLRSPSVEAIYDAKPHLDESYFMLVVLALSSIHGFTMLETWENMVFSLAQAIGDSGRLLTSFSIMLTAGIVVPIAFFALCAKWTQAMLNSPIKKGIEQNNKKPLKYKKVFTVFSFVSLPLALTYHIAHNLNHLLRESVDFSQLLSNPLGTGTVPLSMMELHQRHMNTLLAPDVIAAIQGCLLIIGFLLAMLVIRHRGFKSFKITSKQQIPMIVFVVAITGLNTWLLVQPMVMRM